MSKRPVLILGGASDIGLAIARRFAKEGYPIQLAARRPGELEAERSDIALRHHVDVTLHQFDVLEIDQTERFLDALPNTPGIVVSAVGLLGDQSEAEKNPDFARLIIETNFTGPAIALEAAARRLSSLDEDTAIIGISSVAGDRGRAVNYWYGASKAGLTTTLSGIRQKYSGKNLKVITVKPGFVKTKMTLNLDTPDLLTSQATDVANAIYNSLVHNRSTVYVKSIWRAIMFAIKLMPEKLFIKLKI